MAHGYGSFLSFSFLIISSIVRPLFSSATATVSTQWRVPDGSNPSLSTTWNDGDTVTLSWAAINSSVCDLWLSNPSSANDYALRLATNMNINQAGTFPWAINVGNEQLSISDEYALYFVPTGQAYIASSGQPQVASPSFIILPAGASSSTWNSSSASSDSAAHSSATTSVEASTTTTTISSTATSSTPSNSALPGPKVTGGPSPGVKIGTAVAAVAAVCLIVGLAFWVVRLRRRVKQVESMDDERKCILPSSSSDTNLGPPSSPTSPTSPSSHSPRLLPFPPAVHLEQSSNAKRQTLPGLHEMKADTRQPQELSVDTQTRHSIYEMPA